MKLDELARQVKDGEADKLDLWKAVRGYTYKTAERWYKIFGPDAGMVMDDFMQVGFLALEKALAEYNPDFPFITKYTFCLKKEFAISTGQRKVASANDPLRVACSIDGVVPGTDGILFSELLRDPTAEEAISNVSDAREIIQDMLKDFSPRQQKIIYMRYWKEYSATTMGKYFGISNSAILQSERYIMNKFRKPERIEKLRGLL